MEPPPKQTPPCPEAVMVARAAPADAGSMHSGASSRLQQETGVRVVGCRLLPLCCPASQQAH